MAAKCGYQFDRFDICEAYYLYAVHWHGGQFSELYQVLGRLHNMGFKPGAMGIMYETLSDNGRGIYDSLVERGYLQ